jgi:K+-sensing histidine kinase KdpD
MRALKGVPIVVTVGLVLAVTAVLWRVDSTATGSHHLVYVYLFPVALIAALYNARLALLATAIALICADYFLQKPLYVLGSDNPLEYGDLFVFALLGVTAIKFTEQWRGPAHHWAKSLGKSPSAQNLRQLGDVHGNPSRLVAVEQLGRPHQARQMMCQRGIGANSG